MRRFLLSLLVLLELWGSGLALGRPKIGLVLSGGGAKGLAHIPVLKCLDDLDIPVDYIAGTSAGGIVAALYAIGYSGRDIERIAQGIDWFDYFTDRPPRPLLPFFEKNLDGRYQLEFFLEKGIPRPPSGLIFGQKFVQLFSELTFPLPGDINFDDLPIPFRCVAVDLISGREVVLRQGSLVKAMRATMAVPTIFSPVEWDNFLLIDGGALNNLPVDVVKQMGADIVIAVDLGSPLLDKGELGSADRVLTQTLRIVEAEQKKKNLATADVLIVPDMRGLGSMDYFFPEKLARIMDRGEAAARENYAILAALKEKFGLTRSSEDASSARKKIPFRQRQKKFILERIVIQGNKALPTPLVCRSLGLRSGQAVDERMLSRCLRDLYSKGYFESIHSSVFPLDETRLDLRLDVKEVPRTKLRLGFGYDDFRKLVITGNTVLTYVSLSGLRLESELNLVGLTRFRSRISFSPLTLDFPLYPFLEVHYQQAPTRLYDGGGKRLANYQRKSWTTKAGLGFHLKRMMNLEFSYAVENMDIDAVTALPYSDLATDRKDHLERFCLTVTVDTLDSVWTPRKGFYLRADYEGSYDFTDTSVPYERLEARIDIYKTFFERHTFRLYGFWGLASFGIPFFRFFNQGHPMTFVGMGYDQLSGNRMKILGAQYRYKLSGFVYLQAAANLALDFEQRWSNIVYDPGPLWGIGAGLHLSTPIGPLDLICGLGSKSFLHPESAQVVVYLVLGARF